MRIGSSPISNRYAHETFSAVTIGNDDVMRGHAVFLPDSRLFTADGHRLAESTTGRKQP
jgi:hypothetical protein